MSEFTTSEKLTDELVCSINLACFNLIFLSRSVSSIIVTLFEANYVLLTSYVINEIMHYSPRRVLFMRTINVRYCLGEKDEPNWRFLTIFLLQYKKNPPMER